MQDFNYVWYGCPEITLEVSCCKYPPAHELKKYWDDNQLSLIKFLAEAHRGVQGFVTDANGIPLERVSMKVKGRDVGFLTTKYGEYWRILLPGMYKLEVFADGYVPREIDFMVVEQHPTLLNVTLQQSKVSQSASLSRVSLIESALLWDAPFRLACVPSNNLIWEINFADPWRGLELPARDSCAPI